MAKKMNISGLIVCFVGIVLLIATFIVALWAFLSPNKVESFGRLIPAPEGEWASALKGIGYAMAIALLAVMGSLAGRITAMGIRMFKAKPSCETDQEG